MGPFLFSDYLGARNLRGAQEPPALAAREVVFLLSPVHWAARLSRDLPIIPPQPIVPFLSNSVKLELQFTD